MLDSLWEGIESLILRHPYVYIGVAVLFTGTVALVSAWLYVRALKSNIGTVTGTIVTSDTSDPRSLVIQLCKGPSCETTSPAADGTFTVPLKKGAYIVKVLGNGFLPFERDSVLPEDGGFNIGTVRMRVATKPITLSLHDKGGNPYKNLTIALTKDEETPRRSERVTTDNLGQVNIQAVDDGRYYLTLADPTPNDVNFLWTFSGTYPGQFVLKAAQSSYNITLPRVIFSEFHGANHGIQFDLNGARTFAQRFTLDRKINFCGIGFGIGIGNIGTPNTLEIRKDNAGTPQSPAIYAGTPGPGTGAVSIGRESPYTHCINTQVNELQPGTYWVVATYNQAQGTVTAIGEAAGNTAGGKVLTSIDGRTWIRSALGAVDFFLDRISMIHREEKMIVEIDYPEAKELVDLHGIIQDLTVAEECIKLLQSIDHNDTAKRSYMEALNTAALVCYVRCFNTGKRSPLDDNIFNTNDDAKKAHRYFKDMRDKHIAHSVNPFEQVKVGIHLSDPRKTPKKVLSVCVLSMDRIGESPENYKTFLNLINYIKAILFKKMAELETAIQSIAEKEDIENLYNRAALEIVVPGGPEDARRSRKN